MSLLSSFIQNQLLKAIEAEFQAHSGEIQSLIVNEVKAFAGKATEWVNNKISHISGEKEE
jgi:hypothetical protein